MATIVIQNDEQLPITFKPVNKVGLPAAIDGIPTWSATPPETVDVVVEADGMKAMIKSKDGVTGATKIEVLCDGDLGEGVRPIKSDFDLVVDPSDAEAGSIEVGEPEART